MSKNKYNCTQQELYAVCTHAWNICSQHIEKFKALKARYSQEFIQARLAEIEAAKAIADRGRRSAAQDELRTALKKQVGLSLEAWKTLKGHIQDAWPAEEVEAKLKAAGQEFYVPAIQGKWEATMALMDSGSLFVAANAARMQENQNMPETFAAGFQSIRDAFKAAYEAFLMNGKDKAVLINQKREANNNIYIELMRMFRDGQLAFRGDEAMQAQFVFEAMLIHVSGQGVAGIRGLVSVGGKRKEPVEGLTLSIVETGETTEPDDDGRYAFSQLAAGTYTLKVTAPGYTEQLISNIVVSTGTYKIQNVEMKKVG